MESIFREKREHILDSKPKRNWDTYNPNFKIKTHDNGIPRARTYSLDSKLHFTEYLGYTIKKLIETNFNYFTWLPRNIKNFTYDEDVLKYAKTCLETLENIENYPINRKPTNLGKAISQVRAMIKYEYTLDYEDDKHMLMARKMFIDVEYYKTIINTPLERLIRQSFENELNSAKYRRKYFDEIMN